MAGSGKRVGLDDAHDPLILALDVGSTASRGDVYDAAGRPVEGGRRKVPHQFRTSGDGASEIDPCAPELIERSRLGRGEHRKRLFEAPCLEFGL